MKKMWKRPRVWIMGSWFGNQRCSGEKVPTRPRKRDVMVTLVDISAMVLVVMPLSRPHVMIAEKYERMTEDLSRWIAEKEEGLSDKEETMQKQVQCVQKENDTMREKAAQRAFAFSVHQH